jgi:ankyrin repeat protein
MLAAHFGRPPEITSFLLRRGADVNAATKDGSTALMYAFEPVHMQKVNSDVVKLLLEGGADVNARRADGHTALTRSIVFKGRAAQAAGLLLEKGADADGEAPDGDTMLLFALRSGYFDICDRTDLRQKWVRAFHVTSRESDQQDQLERVKLLLEHGADVNAVNRDGSSAFRFARDWCNQSIVELLKAYGAKE